MRDQLEAAAKKRGWTVTEELLWRLRVSFAKEKEEQREPIMRALCFLISLISPEAITMPEGFPWHRNPFMFRAFRLGVANLLGALEPPGEVKPPSPNLFPSDHPVWAEIYKTPESAANASAWSVLHWLFSIPQLTRDQKEAMRGNPLGVVVDDFDAGFYSMERVRRDLGIKEPDQDTLDQARRKFKLGMGN